MNLRPPVLAIAALLSIFTSQSFSQAWVSQTSGVSSSLSCVSYVGRDTGAVCGASGVILRTTNGGTTWINQTSASGTTNTLSWIRMFSANVGTAVGANGVIRRTTNGGSTWTSQTSGTTQDLNEVFFVDASTAFIVGNNGVILKTTNAGTLWSTSPSGTSNDLNGIYFTSATNGVVIGENGTIRRTTNAGTSWAAVTSGTTQYLHELRFWTADTGLLVGLGGTILRTTNGGANWSAMPSGTTADLVGLAVADGNTAITTGAGGLIRRTTDRGASWASQTSGTSSGINEATFPTSLIGTVVGSGGMIRRTFTGGEVIPLFSVSPLSIAFGTVAVGQNKMDSVTVTNTGIATLSISSVTSSNGQFTVSPASGSIVASGTQKFYITYTPSATGAASANIIFNHNAPGTPDTVTVTGTGVAPGWSVSPTSIPFGSVAVGASKMDSVTVTNTGTSTLSITGVSSTNARFTFSPSSASIAPSGTQKFYITFSPTATGGQVGSVIFTHNATGSPDTVSVTGTGVAPGWSVSPTSIPFGNVVVGASKMDSVTVTNTGTSTLSITGVSSTNARFTFSPSSASIAPSGTQKFYITFSPTATGGQAGSIIFTHNAPGTPDTVAVTGTGVAPGWSVSPSAIPFGNVVVGASKMDSVTVTNTGTSTLSITGVSSTNARFTFSPSSASIAPSGTQKFYITFSPTATGGQAGSIIFTHDATGSPDTVSVTGTGVAPGWSVSPTSIPFGNVVVGASKMDSVTVTNTGTSTLSISAVTSNNARFTVSPSSGSIAPSATQKFYITFSPNAVGGQAGSIIFTHNAPGTPDTVSVTGTGVAPGWSVSPTSIPFGNVVVGASKMDSVTVTNTGTSTLSITGVSSTNARFTFSPSSASIAPSGTQKFYITFSPIATGAQAGSIIFTHDATGSPDTVAVTGTGVAPGWSVSPTSIPFGNVVVGASKMDSVTVTNTGTSTLSISAVTSNNARFTVSPSSGSIAPSGTQKFYITFSPTATGGQAGSIIFTHDATGSPDTVSVTGTGVAPGWSVSPTSIPFGNVVVGASKMDSVTVTNTGTSTLSISAVTSNNARFTVSPSSGSIAPSGTQKFYITFSPTATGGQVGSVIFTHNATGSPDTVSVTGTGVAPGWSVSPTSIPFGNVVVGASKMDSVTVTNTGTSTLSISAVTSNNARFTVSPSSGSIAPSGTQKFYITFSPTATGGQAGSIIFTHDATGSPDTVSVTGTGVAPGWSVSPSAIPFGNVVVGASKMDSVTVTNTGTSTLSITGVSSTNARFTFSPSSASIAPSGTQKFYITFSPTATGGQAGSIIFTHNAPGTPDTVSVTGTGVAPGWSVSPTSIPFGNVVVGASKMDSVTVTNTGTSTLSITGVSSTNARFTFSPSSASIAPSGTQKFYITFSPTATGGQAGSIIFTHDATGSPDTVSVTGTGVAPGWSVSPSAIPFGNVVVGASKMDSVTVTNTGTSTLSITGVGSTNARFTFSPSSASIAPSGTQKFYITFSPTATGGQAGSIIFTHDATGSPDTVSVTGTGVSPGWSVSPTSIPFGNVVVGASKMDSVTVTNTGTSTLSITGVSSTNARFTFSPSSASIAPSGTQKFYITFSPTATGGQAGSIIFTHNATGSPDTVGVTGTGVSPGWSVSPTSIPFGNVVVGASKMDSVTVTNTGTSTLSITGVSSTNARFTFSPSSASIAPSGTQKFYITFSPTATGGQAGSIIFTHDATGSPDTVAVTGTGVAPGWSVSPTSIPFGNVVVGASKMDSVTVTNTGTSTLSISAVTSNNARFTVSPSSASIAPSGTQKFYITFSPTATGGQVGSVIFTHNATGSPDTVSVTGTGVAPGWSVSPTSIPFGNVVVGASKMDSVTVTNTGTSTLSITGVSSTNARFTFSPSSASIAPSGTQKFYITFSPTATGGQAGSVIFTHNATGSPDTVSVTGTGVAPGWSVSPTSIPFGNVIVGASKMDSVTVTNTGTSTLSISAVTSSNARFTVSPSSGSIAPSGTQKFYITFSPTATGGQAGSIIFTHDATGSPDTVAVTGTGVAPGWSVSPTSIPFGNVVVGASKMDSVTVTNTGTSTLSISAVTSSNARFTVSPSSGSIAPSGTQKFYITFSPTATGGQAGSIIFTHDATGSPDTVSVTGTGVAPGWSVSPTSIPFGNVVVGASKMDSVTVTNTGTSTLSITGVSSTNARFTFSPSSASIAPSGTQKFYITFSPTATGGQAGSIIFTHDATGSPDTVSVSGNAVQPGIFISPNSLDFANVVVGNSVLDSVTVTNTGTSTLTLSTVLSDNAEFTVSPSSASIPPSGTQSFHITFAPTNTGSESGHIVFTHDAPGAEAIITLDTVSVAGVGVAPGWSVSPASVAFGNVVVGASTMDSVTVTNTGTSTLSVSAATSNNPRFSVSPASGSIPPSGSQKFYITFNPTATGGQAGSIIFTHDAVGSPDTVSVTGTGVAPSWSITPTSIAFGNVVVGASKMDSVTVTNTGTSLLTISTVVSNNARFSVSPGSGNIAPSGSQKFYITFNPTAVGGENGGIIFTHDAAGSPDTVTVNGTGVAPQFAVTPVSVSFGNVVVGSSAMDSVTVTNNGTSTLTISSTGSDNPRFSVSPGSASIGASSSQKFYITFNPTTSGGQTGNIIFAHDAHGSPDSVAVDGTGVQPGFLVNPAAVAFDTVVIGQSKIDSVTVTNTGTSTLTITGAASTNLRFSVSPGSGAIAPAGSMKFYLTFTPTTASNQSGSIVFTHSAASSPDTVLVSGTGVLPTYTILAVADSGGTISPSGSILVTEGNNQNFSIAAITGHHIDSVVVDGVNQGVIAGYTFTNVTANHTISAYFSINTYIITASAGSNGSITPSGSISVNYGSNQAFTIAADSGYHVDSVIVDGVNQGPLALYTFSNVTANHSIAAYFSITNYLITASGDSGGVISPSGIIGVVSGGNQSFTITPDTGHHIDSVVVDGVNQGVITGYTFNNVLANHTIAAYFSINTYTIAASAGPNGGIAPAGITTVNYGSSQAYTITPNSGYHIDSVRVDGVNQGAITGYTFTNVTANHTIAAYFSINAYTIVASVSGNGTITPSGNVPVSHGANQLFVIAPSFYHHVDSVHVDGVNVGSTTVYTFSNVVTNHTITAFISMDYITFVSMSPETVYNADPVKGRPKRPAKRGKHQYPNWTNLLDETVQQGGFAPGTSESDSAGGTIIGISHMVRRSADPLRPQWKPQRDSAKVRAWVRLTKWDFRRRIGRVSLSARGREFQRTLKDNTGFHTGPPGGLDSTTDGRGVRLVKQVRRILPRLHNNKLYAELVTLKINIAASQLGKTPAGFGDLIFDVNGNPFDEMSVMQISDQADTMMTYWRGRTQIEYDSIYSAIYAINRSFVCPLDTITFESVDSFYVNGKLTLNGTTEIEDVPFLKMPVPFAPTRIVAQNPEVDVDETGDFDSDDEDEYGDEDELPVAARVYQNYPNPFNPSTNIAFELQEESAVTIRVFNMLGQQVATLMNNEELDEGIQALEFKADGLASGVYFYRVDAQGLGENGLRTVETRKMILMK